MLMLCLLMKYQNGATTIATMVEALNQMGKANFDIYAQANQVSTLFPICLSCSGFGR